MRRSGDSPTRAPSRLPRTRLARLPAHAVCLGAGAAIGAVLVLTLSGSPAVGLGLIALAAATFLAVAMGTKVLLGEERLTFYHHAAALALVCGAAAAALGQPLLHMLDVGAAGLAAALSGARVGCLLVGCCHGRPAGWGIRYPPAHAAEGFPAHLVGVRLVPVQAMESLLAAALAALGTILVLQGARPGTFLAACAGSYAAGRFLLEVLRGDPDRRRRAGLTQAQWTSLAIAAGVPAAAIAGLLPRAAWESAPAALLAVTIAATAWRRRSGVERLLRPDHVRELADAARAASSRPARRTSEGLLLTAEQVGGTRLYAFSRAPAALTPAAAGAVARLLLRLRHPGAAHELATGGNGVYHLLVSAPGGAPARG